jgi:cell division protein FtsN
MLQDRLPASIAPSPQTQAKPPAKPRFDFHQILPEMEVVVPDEELSAAAPPPPKPTPKPLPPKTQHKPEQSEVQQVHKPDKSATDRTSYLVQIGSFRKASDAERLKAKLALLGIQARIQQVTVNGKAYHRVRAGPYKGKQEVNKTRTRLSSNGLESIAIKLK